VLTQLSPPAISIVLCACFKSMFRGATSLSLISKEFKPWRIWTLTKRGHLSRLKPTLTFQLCIYLKWWVGTRRRTLKTRVFEAHGFYGEGSAWIVTTASLNRFLISPSTCETVSCIASTETPLSKEQSMFMWRLFSLV